MPMSIARELLPQAAILGTSVNTLEEVKSVKEDGADFVGIGESWDTQNKQLPSLVPEVRGVGRILEVLTGSDIKAVAID